MKPGDAVEFRFYYAKEGWRDGVLLSTAHVPASGRQVYLVQCKEHYYKQNPDGFGFAASPTARISLYGVEEVRLLCPAPPKDLREDELEVWFELVHERTLLDAGWTEEELWEVTESVQQSPC